ncbi:YueH family protein [Bacillus kexueae]|uniref:YueH family protein n=1 Tax=Aeribacillus kexueae TaxID=2078952 RepID=UPI001FB01512|nr:YueH family protein [Bacillus kexueae]
MKIRKANIVHEGMKVEKVYLYENKKEEYTLVSIPDIEWSTIIPYEEETSTLGERLTQSLRSRTVEEIHTPLTKKIVQWVREM